MDKDFSFGASFILEGDTEKVFYISFLEACCKKYPGARLEKLPIQATGEICYVLTRGDGSKILVKLFVVGTISKVTNSGKWFIERCYHTHKPLRWYVFLCYDTDSYLNAITKFHEGDWKALRTTLNKGRPLGIIDLAAAADIEDIMLSDSDSVFSFLDLPPVPIPSGKKGKQKMKRIFRLKGPGVAYHSGNRAESLIQSLDFDRITSVAPIPLQDVERICLGEYRKVENT